VEHFFAVYKDLEGKPSGTEGFRDLEEALQVISEARDRAAS
jgi:inorganic pyrophosphatase